MASHDLDEATIGGAQCIQPVDRWVRRGVIVLTGRKPFAEIKAMKDDPVAVEAKSDEIKANYTKYFRV